MPERYTPLESLHENMERFSKLFPVLLVAIYVFGFLVVMRYLSHFGVSSFDLFKVQYFVAGTWAILPFLLVYIVQFSSNLQHFIREGTDPQTRKLWHAILFYFLGIVAYGLSFYLILMLMSALGLGNSHELIQALTRHQGTIVELIGAAVVVRLIFFYSYFCYLGARDRNAQQRTRLLLGGLASFLFSIGLILAILYLSIFATAFYPLIPHSLGGGRPLSVILVLDCTPPCRSSGLQLEGVGPTTLPYKLLLEGDNSVTVISRSPQETSIEVKRSEISAILVLKDPVTERVP